MGWKRDEDYYGLRERAEREWERSLPDRHSHLIIYFWISIILNLVQFIFIMLLLKT